MRRTQTASRSTVAGLAALLLAAGGVAGTWDALPWAERDAGAEVATTARAAATRPSVVAYPWGRWRPSVPRSTPSTAAPTTTAAPAPTTPPTTAAPVTTQAPRTTTTKAPAPTVPPAPPTTQAPPPPPPPAPTGSPAQQAMLSLVNAQRATGRSCGGTHYGPTHALSLSSLLSQAAGAHALDMATKGYFSHTGADGSDAGTRITRTGYSWSAWGENIAAGQPTAADAVAGWFNSPGHCANFMSPTFTQVGFGEARVAGSPYGVYWASALARPR